MQTKRTKWIVIVILTALLFVLGCNLVNVGPSTSVMPVRSFRLTIEKSQRQELFDQLQKFADEYTYRLVLREYESTESFFVEIWGDDILVTVANVPPDPTLVYISFVGKYPEALVDEKVVDGLVNDLKSYISEIPNVTISEQ